MLTKHWTIVRYISPPYAMVFEAGNKNSLRSYHNSFPYFTIGLNSFAIPNFLVCFFALVVKMHDIKIINLSLKLKTIKLFCFPSRGFRYIRIIILYLSFFFQQSPVNGAFLWFFKNFELINKDLIWHRLVSPRWKNVRPCPVMISFSENNFTDPFLFCSGYYHPFSFLYLTKIFISVVFVRNKK